jgi:hypothetical protein
VSPASGAGVIREHASPCETSWPVINEPAPAINGPAPVDLITSSAAKVALRHSLRVLLLKHRRSQWQKNRFYTWKS